MNKNNEKDPLINLLMGTKSSTVSFKNLGKIDEYACKRFVKNFTSNKTGKVTFKAYIDFSVDSDKVTYLGYLGNDNFDIKEFKASDCQDSIIFIERNLLND